ncbi:A118 family predicted phage portal protein [Virgibacillus natechei]|uniref:A118 family predicted phage portal protein n=1 Tax=Virgibacillus natechei TaxID=1216297 RepID=A0ABS4IKW4_9BACI|nr:phage portal protein [Virgibacillus natechei]MBP1971592.1 A118 family predicted phage portal protein [Virgibacillus natechei]UZD13076.1 phage portal protein [Virgibacillus natechei]
MWKKILNALKGGLAKLGLIRSINSISDHKDIEMDEEMFQNIDVWKDLYRGYHAPFHEIKYHTLDGQKKRTMHTLGLPKVLAGEMASLVFNEKCEISISDQGLSDNIDEVFKQNKFHKKFQDYIEYEFAHGGMVIKPYVEDNKIKLSFVTADCFIPLSWDNDTITEAVFPNEFKRGDKKYTHLEWHLWEQGTYVIRNEVYESSGNDLGHKVSLEQFFPGLDEEVRINGLKKALFIHFKPNTANNIDTQSPLGISIFANALDTIKSIDTAFDSFNREFRLGKKRIIVPSHMVKSVVNTETGAMERYFDSTDETYESFNTQGMDESKIQDVSIELRVDEHIAGINAMLNLLATQTGFSEGTFSFDGQSMKTATEVISENSKTFKSKQSHEIIIEAGLQELVESIANIAKLYGIFSAPDDIEVSVSFDDSIAEDKTAIISKQIQMVTNKLTSKKKAIMKIHGITEDEAALLIAEINDENATATADSVDMFGTGGGNNGTNTN